MGYSEPVGLGSIFDPVIAAAKQAAPAPTTAPAPAPAPTSTTIFQPVLDATRTPILVRDPMPAANVAPPVPVVTTTQPTQPSPVLVADMPKPATLVPGGGGRADVSDFFQSASAAVASGNVNTMLSNPVVLIGLALLVGFWAIRKSNG